MDLSELLGLPFPGEDDPEALALYMHDLAYKLEDLLTTVNASAVAFQNRPCAYWQNAGEAFGANTSFTVDWDLTTPLIYNGDISQTGASVTRPRFPSSRPGLWLVGCSVPILNMTTPNNGTYRRLDVSATGYGADFFQRMQFTGPRIPQDNNSVSLNQVAAQTYESLGGSPGTAMTALALAWVPPDVQIDPSQGGAMGTIEANIAHGNTSSGGTLTANTAFLWAVWMGDGSQQIVQV